MRRLLVGMITKNRVWPIREQNHRQSEAME
jgi:hypothetical protein